ncbi:hypothetical protein AMR72_03015 [Flavobacterium psychrophilum]|nr:hypothetical protein AMR72_03015 [Flavobacterium psychrophilum]AOE51571.1 hypothetical protein ALW18_03015 [Flavobacterium psychrophilum]
MKKNLLSAFLCSGLFFPFATIAQDFPYSVTVLDQVLFYDGYAAVVDQPVPSGVIRHRNDSYAVKLTEEQISSFGNTLTMNVVIKAACDNYDRIGNINLALVPKNQTSYNYDSVSRIEIGRYITPFMNKNRTPTEVPYSYEVNNLTRILKDQTLSAEFDFWVELEVFGVPYSANTQVAGCSGRSDVFFGSLEFVSDQNPNVIYGTDHYFTPITNKANLNNYQSGATDVPGQTTRTFTFELQEAVTNATVYFITSNHGANSGGEEYNRRVHNIYFDNEQELSYIPGGKSCEPYRIYNTQPNGIYGNSPQSDDEWASFSNWCPGDAIPIRTIEVGDLAAGSHSFKIEVPTAQFVGQDGNIPVSAYLQAGSVTLGTNKFTQDKLTVSPNPVDNILTIDTKGDAISSVSVVNAIGQVVYQGVNSNKIDFSGYQSGIYIVKVTMSTSEILIKKVMKK